MHMNCSPLFQKRRSEVKREIGTVFQILRLSLKIAFLKTFFNLGKNNEKSIYKENREHKGPLAKAARVLRE